MTRTCPSCGAVHECAHALQRAIDDLAAALGRVASRARDKRIAAIFPDAQQWEEARVVSVQGFTSSEARVALEEIANSGNYDAVYLPRAHAIAICVVKHKYKELPS